MGILLLLAAIQFTNILDFVIIMPIAPWAQVRYGITPAQFGHVVAAYGFASFVGSILAAKFLDRFGRKTALLTLYLGFSISTLLCGLAPTYETLVAARALTGLFGGVVGAALMAIIGDVFADYRRGTAMGVVMSSFALASIIGLPIGLLLVEFFGTGAPFIALAVASSVVWLGVFRIMPACRPIRSIAPRSGNSRLSRITRSLMCSRSRLCSDLSWWCRSSRWRWSRTLGKSRRT